MRRVLAVLAFAGLVALPLAWPSRGLAAPTVITLEGIETVTGLQRADTNGDGVMDLLLLSGRTLRVYGLAGTKDARALKAAPRHTWTVPDDVSFVIGPAPGLRGGAGPKERIAWLGTQGLGGPAGASAAPQAERLRSAARASVAWRDREQATFADDGLVWAADEEDQPAGTLELLGVGLIFLLLFLAAAFAGGAG